MLALNQTTGYAILALGLLEGPGGKPLLVRDLAKGTGIPKPYLSKMIHELAGKGLVETRRGAGGGVLLARPAGEITLIDVARAVTGREMRFPCLLGLRECSSERACPLHANWMETVESIYHSLCRTSLADASTFQCIYGVDTACPEAKALRGKQKAARSAPGDRKPIAATSAKGGRRR